jgi:hypothetical protein
MTPSTVLDGVGAVRGAVGRHLGTTGWTELTRDQVDLFHRSVGAPPDGTGDSAPPLLVLALTNLFMPRLVEVRNVAMGVNYGTGEVRFPAAAVCRPPSASPWRSRAATARPAWSTPSAAGSRDRRRPIA